MTRLRFLVACTAAAAFSAVPLGVPSAVAAGSPPAGATGTGPGPVPAASALVAPAAPASAAPASAAPASVGGAVLSDLQNLFRSPTSGTAADRPAALVSAEDDRLVAVRRLLPAVPAPFRLTSGGSRTLVLTARSAPYTVADLLALAPQTFVQQSPGTYLLSEHLLVAPGATLTLSRPGGLALRLASGPQGFVTLVALGGHLALTGTEDAPVTVTSWDAGRSAADTEQADGRAYVRAVGGQLETDHVQVAALGFWSGRTGGIAVTGSVRADDDTDAPVPGAPAAAPDTVAPGGPLVAGQPAPPRAARADAALGPSRIASTVVDGDAYGLFVSGTRGLTVSDSRIRHSTVSGVVLHRDVVGGRITRTSSTDGAGDGFRIDRSTSGVTMSEVTAARNARNGITVSGGPLADGPSPTGGSTRSAGGNTVLDSTAEQNARYGIEVQGGDDQRVQDNRIAGGEMGVVVAGPALRAVVSGNTVTGAGRHGISLVDGVRSAQVDGNTVESSADGVYVRASDARVTGNTIRGVRSHGLTFVGEVGGSFVGANTLTGTGRGAAAVDSARATGAIVSPDNEVDGFSDSTSLHHWLSVLLHPMNVLWLIIALLLLVSAVRSRVRSGTGTVHPYAHQMAHHGLPELPDRAAGAGADRPVAGRPGGRRPATVATPAAPATVATPAAARTLPGTPATLDLRDRDRERAHVGTP